MAREVIRIANAVQSYRIRHGDSAFRRCAMTKLSLLLLTFYPQVVRPLRVFHRFKHAHAYRRFLKRSLSMAIYPDLRKMLTHIGLVAFIVFGFLVQPTYGAALPDSTSQWHQPFRGGFTLVKAFNPPDRPWLSGSRGVWLNLHNPRGTIESPCDGTVIYSAELAGRKVLSIDCGGIHSTFEPVVTTLRTGQYVRRGEQIASVPPLGSEWTSTSIREGEIHWGAKVSRTRYINPLRMLTGHPRLKTL